MLVKPLTWAMAINAAEVELARGQIVDPRLNAELLAAYVLGIWMRGEVRQLLHRSLSEEEHTRYQELLRRRLAHEPLQHITGETEFFGLRLYCSPAALIPRPDTEILVEEALKEAKSMDASLRVLDIGTGSGCIALALASKLPNARVVGIDTSEDALALADKNRLRLQLSNVELRKADVHDDEAMKALGQFDMIVSNPPYIPIAEYLELEQEVRDFEPRNALTDEEEGISYYAQIGQVAQTLLKPGGKLLVEIGHGSKDRILDIVKGLKFTRVVEDLSGIERVILWDENMPGVEIA